MQHLRLAWNHSFFTHTLLASLALWKPLQWCHNDRNGVSNHRRLECLLKRLFRRRSKKTLKLCVTGLCKGNSPVTDESSAQRASNTEMFPFDVVIMHTVALMTMKQTWRKWVNKSHESTKSDSKAKQNHMYILRDVLLKTLKLTNLDMCPWNASEIISSHREGNIHHFIKEQSHERHGVPNHQQRDYLFNRWFRLTTKRNQELRITGPLRGESAGDRWIPLKQGQ